MSAFHQPYYVLDFKSTACKFTLLVNDVPAFGFDNNGSINSQVPINHLILQSGNQSLSYLMQPVTGQQFLSSHSELEVTVAVTDAINSSSTPVTVATFKPIPVAHANVPEIRQQYAFKAEVPYTLEGWQQGINLKNDQNIKNELVATYQKIEQILKSRRFDELKKIYNPKSVEIDKAMYMNPNDDDSDWQDLVDYIGQPGMEVKFDADQALLHFYGDSKLVTLQKPNQEPALYFENLKDKEEYQFPFLFYRKAPGQPLTVIR